MSRQQYNMIRQLLRSILTEYVVSSCSFLVMLTKALNSVIWSNGHISKTTEPILKIFAATDSATMVSG